MRIIYVCGNRYGAHQNLTRILPNLSNHEVLTVGFYKTSYLLKNIDIVLEPLTNWIKTVPHTYTFNNCDKNNSIKVDKDTVEHLFEIIKEFKPDLFICDEERVFSRIASHLNVECWYCSPLNLFTSGIFNFSYTNYYDTMNAFKKQHLLLPKSSKHLIYSPFCSYINYIYPTAQFIKPYYNSVVKLENPDLNLAVISNPKREEKLRKVLTLCGYNFKIYNDFQIESEEYKQDLKRCKLMFTTGETSVLSDALLNQIPVFISPTVGDPESCFNAFICYKFKLGSDVGQLEYLEEYAKEHLDFHYKDFKLSPIIREEYTLSGLIEEYEKIRSV